MYSPQVAVQHVRTSVADHGRDIIEALKAQAIGAGSRAEAYSKTIDEVLETVQRTGEWQPDHSSLGYYNSQRHQRSPDGLNIQVVIPIRELMSKAQAQAADAADPRDMNEFGGVRRNDVAKAMLAVIERAASPSRDSGTWWAVTEGHINNRGTLIGHEGTHPSKNFGDASIVLSFQAMFRDNPIELMASTAVSRKG